MEPNVKYNHGPIKTPSEDRLGVDRFSKSLAASIRKAQSPEGLVFAINARWGFGKTSAVNLVLHHLRIAAPLNELKIIEFKCWWFKDEDALARAFFRELNNGVVLNLGKRIRKILPTLSTHILSSGPVVGSAIDVAGGTGIGQLVSRVMSWLTKFIRGSTVEKLHSELSDALLAQAKRFLIVIDDMDRLSPDEMLLMFRLIKTIGHLPNVIYLLVYDRQLAEKIVSARFPADGPNYLEKIIQASFDLPAPDSLALRNLIFLEIRSMCGSISAEQEVRFTSDLAYRMKYYP